MTLLALLKTLHVSCALLSISGFAMRGYWALQGNPLLQNRLTRVLPHLIDTCLLGTAAGILWIWGVSPLGVPWLMAKLSALLLYIALGMVAMRFARSHRTQCFAYVAALLVASYIIMVALTHSPWGWLEVWRG